MTEIYEVSYEIFLVREIFNIALICALLVFAIFMYSRTREKESKSAQQNILFGYFLFLVSFAMTRLFFVFSDFEIFNAAVPETPLNTIYVGIAYSFGILGAIWLIFMLERHLLHTYFIFSILAVIILGMSIISIFALVTTDIIRTIIAIAFPAFFIIVVMLYLYVAIKSSGEARKRALGIVLGLFIIMIGFLLGSSLSGSFLDPKGLYVVRILVEPFIVIVGGAVFTLSQR